MKRRSRRGETLTETLMAMLIVSLMMLGLASAITAAARVNRETEQAVASCNMSRDAPTAVTSVTLRWGGGSTEAAITQYEDNGYYFYEKTTE